MNRHLEAILRRKQMLIDRSAAQRAVVGGCILRLQTPARMADRALHAVIFLKSHPVLLAAMAVGVIAARPRGFARWAGRALIVWRGWRATQAWLR